VIGTTPGRAHAAAESAGTRRHGRVLLVLPRADHVRGYAPLASVLADRGVEPIVVTGARDVPVRGEARRVAAEFYGAAGGGLSWLRLVLRREITARQLMRRLAPDALVVPSDVSDALSAFVAAARRRRLPVVYVQGVPVFADFPRLNAQMHALRSRSRRFAGAAVQSLLRMVGIHVATGAKAVLGSRADHVLVMDEVQRQIHVRAGVPAERVRVTGAPFVDRLVALRRAFDGDARTRALAAVGIDGRVALVLTKSLHRLGWTTRAMHETLVREMVAAVRGELPGWVCLVKLHPTEMVDEYRALLPDDANVRVVRDAPVEELLLASDVAVSLGTSGAALSARVLGTRLIVVTHPSIPMLGAHGDVAVDGGTVRSAAELRRRLRELRAATAPPAAAPTLDQVWADGRASERIADVLRAIVPSPPAGWRG
jgi:UDP-N-acetylglucosamine 2-epimerase